MRKQTVKQINDRELGEINVMDVEVNLADANIKIEQIKLDNLRLRQQILALESEKLQAKIVELNRAKEGKHQSRREYLKTIAKRLKLKEGWGFNPLSGEIIDGE